MSVSASYNQEHGSQPVLYNSPGAVDIMDIHGAGISIAALVTMNSNLPIPISIRY